MPSPFPGMDPFIEGQEWKDFHTTAITVARELLNSNVGPRYVVRIERRVYLEHYTEAPDEQLIADVAVLKQGHQPGPSGAATVTAIAPVECILPMPEEQREAFLEIRDRETMEVVTVIELLSPTNKRPGANGRDEYLAKREAVLESQSHLVELDLLRGGKRLPSLTPLPPGDYFAVVSRRRKRPKADVYGWPLSHRLPPIPIPLREEDGDATLDLQAVLDTVYDRARYDLSIDYQAELRPVLSETDAAWLRPILDAWRKDEQT